MRSPLQPAAAPACPATEVTRRAVECAEAVFGPGALHRSLDLVLPLATAVIVHGL